MNTLNGGESPSSDWLLRAQDCQEIQLGAYGDRQASELPAFTVEEINQAIETLQEQR